MKSRPFVNAMIAMLILTYAFSLIVSTTHLAELYASYDRNAGTVSIGLAVALELSAFLLSITSTALAGLVSKWATGAATFALLLVWFGNGYSMYNSSPDKPLWVTVLLSCFVPVGTFAVGKVLGSLFQVRDTLTTQAVEAPRILELSSEIEQLKTRLAVQTRNEQTNIQQAIRTTREQVRAELTYSSQEAKESLPQVVLMPQPLPELQIRENVALPPLPENEELHSTDRQPDMTEDEPGDEMSGGNQRGAVRTLSKLQREVFIFIKETGPSQTDQIADLMNKSKSNIEKVLEALVEKKFIVEDNGIFQAVV